MSEVQTATIQTDVPIGLLAEIVLFILQQSVYAPKPQGAVAAAGDNEVPIRTECNAYPKTAWSFKDSQLGTRPHIPQRHSAVIAFRRQHVTLRTERKAQDSAGMAKVATTARMASDPRAVLMVVPGRQPTVFVLPQRSLRIR